MRKIRKRREKQKKKILIISIFTFLLIMTSGYAAFSTNITLTAKGNIKCNPEIVKEKLIKELTTSGDGLYEDSFEENRYIYKGENPNNYIEFNGELWRIVSLESDGTIKIYKEGALGQNFDEAGYRDNSSNGAGGTYCNQMTSGCNVWAATNKLVGNPLEFSSGMFKGTVLLDSTLNEYLNNEYYNSLNSDKNYIVMHNFNIGQIVWYDETMFLDDVIEKWNNTASEYIWNGKIGLLSPVDILKANIENTTCSISSPEGSTIYDSDEYNCHLNSYLKSENHRNMYLISPKGAQVGANMSTVSLAGEINDATPYHPNTAAFSAAISFYLDSNIKLCGSGEETNPYTIYNQ